MEETAFAHELSALGISAGFAPQLVKYAKELQLFNSSFDLVGAESLGDILTKHVLDSLAAYAPLSGLIQKLCGCGAAEIADVGSGGGLPGIPLAVVFPQARFTLIERMSKRCAFLENCKLVLGLGNVQVANCEAEKVPPHSFDIVVFRAFRPLDEKMARTLLRLPKSEGVLAAYKAKKSKIEEEMRAVSALVPEWEAVPLEAPFLGGGKEGRERHLVIIPARQNPR